MTEPWEVRGNGFVWFLNFLLAFVFPVIPWEVFWFLPWIVAYLGNRAIKNPGVQKGKISHLILGVSLFCGIYAGLAHPLGLIQAWQSIFGYDGICVVHPPPNATGSVGPPFKLYYGWNKATIDTAQYSWCVLLGLHVIFMCFAGWYSLWLLCHHDKPRGRSCCCLKNLTLMLNNPPVRTLYVRCVILFLVGGWSQAAPYVGLWGSSYFDTILVSTGGYSKRPFSPGLSENLAAWSWIIGGFFFLFKVVTDKGIMSEQDDGGGFTNNPAASAVKPTGEDV